MTLNNEERDDLIRKLYSENAELRRKVEFLTNLVGRISGDRDSLREQSKQSTDNKHRYHDPEDRSWRAWPSDDAAE